MEKQLTKNFKLSEFLKSDTALKKGIDNTPTESEVRNIEKVAIALQSIRDAYGKSIVITSGYRSKKLNAAVGGSQTSAHVLGFAVDFKPVDMSDMAVFQDLALKALRGSLIPFDQYIIEKPVNGVATWIHLGVGPKQRMQTLTIK